MINALYDIGGWYVGVDLYIYPTITYCTSLLISAQSTDAWTCELGGKSDCWIVTPSDTSNAPRAGSMDGSSVRHGCRSFGAMAGKCREAMGSRSAS